MQRVEDYETPEEIVPNRLKLRQYLRELHLNQKRIVKVATEKHLQERLQKEKAQAQGEGDQPASEPSAERAQGD